MATPAGASASVLLVRLALGGVLIGEALRPGAPTGLGVTLIVIGALLLAGLFTWGAGVAAGVLLLAIHVDVLHASAGKNTMWSTIVYLIAVAVVLRWSNADRWSLDRYCRLRGSWVIAQGGPRKKGRAESAALALRLALGADFLFAGLSKFRYPWVEQTVRQFSDTALPPELVRIFATGLPYAQTILGASLALGLFTGVSALLTGVMMLFLLFGQLALGAPLLGLWSMFLYLLAIAAIPVLSVGNRASLDFAIAKALPLWPSTGTPSR